MRTKYLVIILFGVVIASWLVVEIQKNNGKIPEEMPPLVLGGVGRGLQVSSSQVLIRSDSTHLGVIHLPAKGGVFSLYFNSVIDIDEVKVEDVKGMHYMYSLVGYIYDRAGHKQICQDTLNLHGFRHQDNEFYEFSRLSKKMLCKVKENPLNSPRIIYIDFWRASVKPQLVMLQEGR